VIYQGRVYIFGNDINTDEIIPARYLNTSDPKVLAKYCMEDSRPGFAQNVDPGSIMVAGNNFGCGSSREHAPISIKEVGIACVVAASFARIFFRNAINIGLPIVECPALVNRIKEGEELKINLEEGAITLPSGEVINISPFPPFMQAIISQGGWLSYLNTR